MRVLVTGGAGFIGSSVVYLLLGSGWDVGIVDDLSTGKVENVHPRAWFRRLDILDPSFAALVHEFAPDAVVHLAAQASVAASIRDPERDWAVNAEGTKRVAAAAAEVGAKRVLSASSAAVYGDPATLPLPESAPTEPLSPYGRSKLEAERLLARELDGTAVDFGSLRFANVYGPRQDAAGEGGVVALFLDAIAHAREPIIYGDGHQTRDFIYVADVASAIHAALESEARLGRADTLSPMGGPDGGGLGAYNVSTGTETSVNRLTDHIRAATRYGGVFPHAPAREGDIARSTLDPAKAARVFGWRATVPLERGLAATWRWFSAES